MARNRKNSPWLKETSDRSGFDNFDHFGKRRWRGVKKNGLLLEPDEIDTPPLSTKSLGGADISSGSLRSNSTSTSVPSVSDNVIQYITAGGGITLNDQPWLMVVGSLQTVNITVDPQIQLGYQGQIMAVQCVGSGVILDNSAGLALAGGKSFEMISGSIINLVCNRTNNLWVETARVKNGGI